MSDFQNNIAAIVEADRAQVRQEERERIIKLLKEHFDNPEGCPCDLCWKFAGTKLITLLIKGEK